MTAVDINLLWRNAVISRELPKLEHELHGETRFLFQRCAERMRHNANGIFLVVAVFLSRRKSAPSKNQSVRASAALSLSKRRVGAVKHPSHVAKCCYDASSLA